MPDRQWRGSATISGWCINALDSLTEVADRSSHQIFRRAGSDSRLQNDVCRFAGCFFSARGCGEKMMALRIQANQRFEDRGRGCHVAGTIPQIMPIGSAMVMVPKVSSSHYTPQVFSSYKHCKYIQKRSTLITCLPRYHTDSATAILPAEYYGHQRLPERRRGRFCRPVLSETGIFTRWVFTSPLRVR